MNDPMPDFSQPEYSRMARQMAEALNLPDWDQLDDSQLEELLDSTESGPLSESQHDHIIHQAQNLIQQWETPAMATPNPESRSMSPRTPVATADSKSHPRSSRSRANRTGSGSAVVLAGMALLAMAVLFYQANRETTKTDPKSSYRKTVVQNPPMDALQPLARVQSPVSGRIDVGAIVETQVRERRRVTLPDGSVAFLNENTRVEVKSSRRLAVQTGEVFVEVVPAHLIAAKTPFVVETPDRNVTALGTKFRVKADKNDTDVLVTQGKVKVSGVAEPLTAGQQLKKKERLPAPRASEALLWTKELMAAAESPLIPKSEHAGGALVAIDPSGQEMQLSLRKQHVDVHIEDGFARTTIDQTYFNASWSRMEGTFYFPLPVDASLSRLAMYVGENLMEGGMAERDHARNVFEQIRYTRRDPALLEWVDGSTFKMRVFPLEGRQEKRIVISYTQRLESAYGKLHYRFPAGHSLELIRDWSTHVLVKNHGNRTWTSPSHKLESQVADKDLVLEKTTHGLVDDRDLVIELEDEHEAHPRTDVARFSRMMQDGRQYLMMRFRPDLRGELQRKPRNWVFLFESAGNRDSLLARVQIDVLHTLLKNAEHSDTFSIITAATRTKAWKEKPLPCTPENIEKAIEHLGEVHLLGALNLEKALTACQPFLKPNPKNPATENYLVHLGAGVAVLGEKETPKLLDEIPASAKYIGVGVGKRWSQTFMKAAANRTGGHVTQINPDEQVTWRSFELLSLLNSPRVLNVKVTDNAKTHRYLQFSETLAQGEELCAVIRLGADSKMPGWITITGQLAGKPYEKQLRVKDIADGAGYLPRTWAKLEIDRLVADGAAKHKKGIIELSKAMYVMSPFTSLLVLENDQMYEQFKVDRGRKDHWVLYPCPKKIQVVFEPNGGPPVNRVVSSKKRAKSKEELLKTILVRTPPVTYRWTNGAQSVMQGLNAAQVYTGAFAQPQRSMMGIDYDFNVHVDLSDDFIVNLGDVDFLDSGLMARPGPMVNGPGPGLLRWGRGPIAWDDNRDGYSNTIFLDARSATTWEWSGPEGMSMSGPVSRMIQPLSQFGATRTSSVRMVPFGRSYVAPPLDFSSNGLFGTVSGYDTSLRNAYQFWGVSPAGLADPQSVNLQFGFAKGFKRQFGEDGLSFRNSNSFANSPLGFDWYTSDELVVTPGRFILQLPSDGSRLTAGIKYLPALDDWPKNGTVVGLGSPGQFTPDLAISFYDSSELAMPNSFVSGNWSLGRFGDLVAYAPGMNTTQLDVLSLLESQGPADLQPKRGKIDPKAQALIARSREHGWESVTLPHAKGKTGLVIRCDGQGRYIYERKLSEGLTEQIVNDGQRLLHLYSAFGLGARRDVNRFHRSQLSRMVPWFVPPAEDLAVGCDVRFVNEHAVALVPLSEEKSGENPKTKPYYVLLVFREDGQLQERRLVVGETQKSLVRVEYDPDGSVRVFDKDDKRVAQRDWKRATAQAPDLKPDLKDLVVLSLPLRSTESLLTAPEQQLANGSNFANFDEEKSLALLGSYHATGNAGLMNNLLNQKYYGKDDHRLGLYVLQASVHQQVGYGNQATQLTAKHPNSPLAAYLRQHFAWVNSGNTNQEFVVKGPESGLVQRLALARNLFVRWSTGQAVNNRSATEIRLERQRSLAELKKLQSPAFAWMLLRTMQKADKDSRGLMDYIRAAEELSQEPGLEIAARYQSAFWQSEYGDTAEAVKELETLTEELLQAGILPPISEQVQKVFVSHDGQKAWTRYVTNLQTQLLKDKGRYAALQVAIQAGQIKQNRITEDLLAEALKDLVPKEYPLASLLAAEYLMKEKRFAEAERFLVPFLKMKGWDKQPQLWRKASELARLKKEEALSVARLERAMQLEYENLPELINLQTLRNNYQELLSRMQALANFQDPEADLKQRAIRVADRWRVVDPDDTAACRLAARIVALLGDQELAWDYLTTPLADKPNESAPWVALAKEMSGQKKIELADRAYRQAFDAEATNAQILWDHAELLRQNDRDESAQELYEQLAREDWQPRFRNLKNQAQQRLNAANSKDGKE